jgi:oxygen-independent coproporphyrinogen-3 oxidase
MLREQILKFMTRFRVSLDPEQQADAREFLGPMIEDGLVEITDESLRLTEKGTPFLRNACMFFDQRLRSQAQRPRVFSQAL